MFWKKGYLDNVTFGKIRFLNGWQKMEKFILILWENEFQIYIRATASNKSEKISAEQEKAFLKLSDSVKEIEKTIETVMQDHFPNLSRKELIKRFVPDEILISRDGCFGICISDREDEDCGIQPDADLAIALSPEVKYYDNQDDYICLVD